MHRRPTQYRGQGYLWGRGKHQSEGQVAPLRSLPCPEALQLAYLVLREFELVAKLSGELLDNVVRNYQFVVGEHILEELGTYAGSTDRRGDQYRGIQNNLHERSSARNISSSVCRPWAWARRTSFARRR